MLAATNFPYVDCKVQFFYNYEINSFMIIKKSNHKSVFYDTKIHVFESGCNKTHFQVFHLIFKLIQ